MTRRDTHEDENRNLFYLANPTTLRATNEDERN